MNSNTSQAAPVVVVANPNLNLNLVYKAGAHPRNTEQARTERLIQRYGVPPHIAPLVAHLAFGEGRAQ